MPTLSMETCYCGAEKREQAPGSGFMYCPHCDRTCQVEQGGKEKCPRCQAHRDYWKVKIDEFYGPGRGAV